uniref:Sushi domain-containing protein n=1 Tax=Taeniopygia guttata TaxID=59729 RepID=A0A674HK39_TAEGU
MAAGSPLLLCVPEHRLTTAPSPRLQVCDTTLRVHCSFMSPHPEHRNAIDFSVGKTVQYTCLPGYAKVPGMSPTLTCLEGCSPSPGKQCGHPGEPVNGKIISLTNLQFGSTVAEHSCTSAGIPCEPPPDIPHGQHSGRLLSEFHYGTAVSYSCQPGFPLHGHPSIHCTTRDGYSGVWSEPLPACGGGLRARDPQIVAARSAYSHRDTVTFECEPGYAIRGHREIQCQPNNTWEPPVPVCEQGKCPSRASPSPAPQIHLLCLFNAGVELVCQPGYTQLPGASAAITCLRNQTWSAAFVGVSPAPCAGSGFPSPSALPGQCVGSADHPLVLPTGLTCAPPPAIPHGTHSGGSRDSFSLGDVVTYTCASGLALAGGASLSCTSVDGQHGTWSGAVPRCQGRARLCPQPALAVPGTRDGHSCGRACTHGEAAHMTDFIPSQSVFKTTRRIYTFFNIFLCIKCLFGSALLEQLFLFDAASVSITT